MLFSPSPDLVLDAAAQHPRRATVRGTTTQAISGLVQQAHTKKPRLRRHRANERRDTERRAWADPVPVGQPVAPSCNRESIGSEFIRPDPTSPKAQP